MRVLNATKLLYRPSYTISNIKYASVIQAKVYNEFKIIIYIYTLCLVELHVSCGGYYYMKAHSFDLT